MCGISFVLDHGGAANPILTALSTMHGALAHRGPDGEGWLLVDDGLNARRFPHCPNGQASAAIRVAVAFRRLAIQDLSAGGGQPLAAADERHWIVYNGEIYNHAALRSELTAAGHRFLTKSDTEVALTAYRQWGTACFERFNGMWAMLIIDLQRQRLVGSRDRLGIKPLFWTCEPGRLSFASEPQALALARSDGPRVEPRRFLEFLRGLPPQSPALSFFRDVHPVPAGTLFEIDLRDRSAASPPRFGPFWDLAAFQSADAPPPYEEAVDAFRGLFHAAIDAQLPAAVPVGCLLSGGLDASMVATTMAARLDHTRAAPLRAYSLVYEDPQMSEAPYIQIVAARAGLDSRRQTLTPGDAWNSIDAVVRAQGQPLLGQDVIAQYHAYRLARAHGTIVVLEGQGADELLAGLPGYETAFIRELLVTLQLRELLTEVRCRARRYHESPLRILRRQIAPALRMRPRRRKAYAWLNESNQQPEPATDPGWGPSRTGDPSLLNQRLYRLVRHTNLPTVLLYQDRSSMAHGVESRVPFLDHRLVEFCFRLPANYKVRYGQRKRILLDAARGVVPDAVTNRTDKKTFVSRLDWMPLRRDYASQVRAMARSQAMATSPYVRRLELETFVEDYLTRRHDDQAAVWRLYTAWRWLEAFHAA